MCCRILKVTRSAYYKWNNRIPGKRELENQRIAEIAEQIHTENPDKGYRRINDDLAKYHDIHINDKRALRICRKKNLKSTIKYTNNGCTKSEKDPQIVAENILNREFHADAPNEKCHINRSCFYFIQVFQRKCRIFLTIHNYGIYFTSFHLLSYHFC